MAEDEGASKLMKITVKTATKKEVVQISENSTVKDVSYLSILYSF